MKKHFLQFLKLITTIILWVYIQKISKLGHALRKVLNFKKSQGGTFIFKFFLKICKYCLISSKNIHQKEHLKLKNIKILLRGPKNGFWPGQRKTNICFAFSYIFVFTTSTVQLPIDCHGWHPLLDHQHMLAKYSTVYQWNVSAGHTLQVVQLEHCWIKAAPLTFKLLLTSLLSQQIMFPA